MRGGSDSIAHDRGRTCLGSSLGEGQPICKAAGDGGDLLMFNSPFILPD